MALWTVVLLLVDRRGRGFVDVPARAMPGIHLQMNTATKDFRKVRLFIFDPFRTGGHTKPQKKTAVSGLLHYS